MSRSIIASYRVRGFVLFISTAVLLVVAAFGRYVTADAAQTPQLILIGAGLLGWVFCLVMAAIGPKSLPKHEAITVTPPVHGRWLALNSPASKIPSHGTHSYGQAHAIDLLHEPEGYTRPAFGTWPAMREPEEFKAFGQPVTSMVDGTVVRASDWRRDHRSRSNLLAFAYLMGEGVVREIGGPGFMVGNHVTVRTADGVFATIAHLQQGSKTVKVGDTVRAGDQLGLCGNSGNSSEPHVHAQLADRKSFWTAQGLPFVFADIAIDDGTDLIEGLPRNGKHLTAG